MNVLKGFGARIADVPPDFLDQAIKIFTEIAERNGGKMMGKYQLTAKPTSKKVTADSATVIMQGVPSGFWAWRETGAGAHVIKPRRKKALAGNLDHPVWGPVIHPGFTGKGMWTKTVTTAEDEIYKAAERAWEKAVA